jgi:Methyltransferase domain
VTNSAQNVPLSLARMAAALTYLDALDQIEGWLLPTTALAMIEALWAQERRGYAGDIAEIGVWQGKSFLALAAGARPGERLVAIDPFDAGDPTAQRPDLDVTPYGAGYKGAFLANLSRFFPAVQPEIIEASSGALANDRSPLGKLRFLSIDGGHSRAQTLIDLRIADACLTEQGLCWLDDVFNPAWPGVVSGLFAYLDSGPGLQPLVLFPNKLVLVRPAMAETWRTEFRALFAGAISREGVELHRFAIDVYDEAWSKFSSALRPVESAAARAAEQRAAALSACQARAANAEHRAAAAEAALLACQTSTSWRVTSPLRLLGHLLRHSAKPRNELD